MDFDDLVKYAKSVAAFLLPVNFKSGGVTSHKHNLAAKTVSNSWSPKSLLWRQISSRWRALQRLKLV